MAEAQTAQQYAPVALFLVIAVAFGLMLLNLGALFRPSRPTREKARPYECGNEPIGTANRPIVPRYWFFAMLLVLFDVEVAFLVPWALEARDLGIGGFLALALFFLVITGGYLYLWRAGDLEWD